MGASRFPGGSSARQLSVGGKATLAGTLKVNTGNGFVPGHGQSFSVLRCHTRSGTFGTLSGTPAYAVSYTATAANVGLPVMEGTKASPGPA